MSLGIGLGAFAGGFKQGYGMGKQIKSDFAERKFQKEMTSSYESSQKKFQEGLAAGTYNEDQFMDVWKSESAPKIREYFLKNGKVKEAQEWDAWATGDKGAAYAKLYGNARFQFGVGDYDGFANSLNQMAQSAGLDYNFSHIGGDDGNPARIRSSSKDGSRVFGDHTMDKVPNLLDQWFNPVSGFQYQTQQTNNNTAKAPGIGGGMSLGEGQQGWENLSQSERRKIYNEERKFLADNDPDFLSLSAEQQDEKIHQNITRSLNAPGLSSTNSQKLVIDTRTGKPVQSAPAAGQQQPMQGQPAVGDGTSSVLTMGAVPRDRDGLISWATQAKKAGLGDAAIAYGWNGAAIADKGELPEEFSVGASGQLTQEEMERVEASLGLTDRGKKIKQHSRDKVDNQTRSKNIAKSKQAIIQKLEQSFKEGSSREGLYQLMEKEGISIDELPENMRRIMRDYKPGIWSRTKQVFGFPAYEEKDKKLIKEPFDVLMKRHAETEYKDNKRKEWHEKEKRMIKLVQSGKMDASTVELWLADAARGEGIEPSREFIKLLEHLRNGVRGGGNPDTMPGLGTQNIPIPRDKPRTTIPDW